MVSRSCTNLFCRLGSVGENTFLGVFGTSIIPYRTTFILKRRHPVNLVKRGEEEYYRKLKAKNYIYDLVEDTEVKKRRNIQVVLTTFVEGLGEKGDIVEVNRNFGYNKLILPGLAGYVTEEDLARASQGSSNLEEKRFSSKTAPTIIKYLERMVLGIVMNKETPWTLEPWHVKASFRKAGVIVPQDSIILPKQAISGPDLSLENKDFVVHVLINKREKAQVRARIHHWSTSIHDRLPYVNDPWCQPHEPLFKEEAPILQQLPFPPYEPDQPEQQQY